MPIENEIKFVLSGKVTPESLSDWDVKKIRQGYLGNTAHLIREGDDCFLAYRDGAGASRKEREVRIPVDKADFDELWEKCSVIETGRLPGTPRIRQYGGQYLFTYKEWVKGRDVRIEVESEISDAAFEALWPHCHATMYKDRYIKNKDGIEWVVDFMRKGNEDGQIYFVLAEAEMPADMGKPDKIIKPIRDNVLFEVPKGNKEYTSRKLCDTDYAEKMLNDIGYKA